jgi:hypothetical protein
MREVLKQDAGKLYKFRIDVFIATYSEFEVSKPPARHNDQILKIDLSFKNS